MSRLFNTIIPTDVVNCFRVMLIFFVQFIGLIQISPKKFKVIRMKLIIRKQVTGGTR